MARPTKYKPEYAEMARKLCLLGFTDVQLGDHFGVEEKTINNWKTAHPKFLQSLRGGKEVADAEVAASLYHRALGYEHPEDKVFCSTGKDGKAVVTTVATVKHYPPDTGAAFIWLKNRAGWRDKQDVVVDAGQTLKTFMGFLQSRLPQGQAVASLPSHKIIDSKEAIENIL